MSILTPETNRMFHQSYPQYYDMELELLGMCILKEGACIPQVVAVLTPDDFYNDENRYIFAAIVDLYNSGNAPTMPLIADWLHRHGYIFQNGADKPPSPYDKVRIDTIMNLGRVAFTTAYADSYAEKIKEMSNRRQISLIASKLQMEILDPSKNFAELVANVENAFHDISANTKPQKLLSEFNYFTDSVVEDINKNKLYAKRKTGFCNIDSFQIFSPGLYVIGATPAAGKTTFCWQLLNQLAQNDEYCIFCSYEMSALELYSKTLAKELFLRDRSTALTAADIRRGSFSEDLEALIIEFSTDKKRKGVNLFELRDESIEDLLRLLRPLCTNKDKSPVVCVDYMQIIPPSNDIQTDKARIDDIVHKLKSFQRDTNTTFIVVSSFNRINYYQQVSFESFKESGNIEYTADVVWALQLEIANTIKTGSAISETRKKFEEAKRQQPRHIQLKCLKNRQGTNYDCFFNYYSAHDFFEPSGQAGSSQDIESSIGGIHNGKSFRA